MHTLESLKSKTNEVGDCWIWKTKTKSGPHTNVKGKVMPVRAYIYKELLGKKVIGRLVTMSCCNKDCINPDHIITLTRQQLQQRTARVTQYGASPARRAKIAKSKQKLSFLDWEQVREIRQMDGSMREIARQTGLNFSVIRNIRNGLSWQEPGNPFAMLMRA